MVRPDIRAAFEERFGRLSSDRLSDIVAAFLGRWDMVQPTAREPFARQLSAALDASQPPGELETLGDLGQVYVTMRATRQAERFLRCGEEEARRQLTIWMSSARFRGETPDGTTRWRFVNTRAHISATVALEAPLAIVLTAEVRGARGGR